MPARAPPSGGEEEEEELLDLSRVLVTQKDGQDYQLRVYIPNSSSRETLRAIVKELGGKAHTKTAKAADYAVVDPKAPKDKLALLWDAIRTDRDECRIVDVAWLLRCKQKGRRLRHEKWAIAQPEVKPRAPFTEKYKDTKTLYNDAVDLPLMAKYLVREKKDERGASSINTWEAFVRRYPNNGHTAQSWKQKYKVNKHEVDRLAQRYRRTVDKRRDRGEDLYTADEGDEDEAPSDDQPQSQLQQAQAQAQEQEDGEDDGSSDHSNGASNDGMPIKKGKTARPSSRKGKERQSDVGQGVAASVAYFKRTSGYQQGEEQRRGKRAGSAIASPRPAAFNAPMRKNAQTGFIDEDDDDGELEGETEEKGIPVASTSRLAATTGQRRASLGAAGLGSRSRSQSRSRSRSRSGSSARPVRPSDSGMADAQSTPASRTSSRRLNDDEMRDESEEQDYDGTDCDGRTRRASTKESHRKRAASAPRASASVRRGVTTDLGSSGRPERGNGAQGEAAARAPVQREQSGEAAEDEAEDEEDFVLPPPLSATAAGRLVDQRDDGDTPGEPVATRKRKRSSVAQMERTDTADAQTSPARQREHKKRRIEDARSVSRARSSAEPLRLRSESTAAGHPPSREVSTVSSRRDHRGPVDTLARLLSTPADFGLDAITDRSASASGSEADPMEAGALAQGSRRGQTRSAPVAQERQAGGEADDGEAMTGREGRGGSASTAAAAAAVGEQEAGAQADALAHAHHDKGKGRDASPARSPGNASAPRYLLPPAPAALRSGLTILSDGLSRHDGWTTDCVEAHFSEVQLDDIEFLMNGDRAAAKSFANLLGSGKQSGGGQGLTRAQLEEWAQLRKVMWTPEQDIEVLGCVDTGIKRVGPHSADDTTRRMKFLGAYARQHGPRAVERRRFPFEK